MGDKQNLQKAARNWVLGSRRSRIYSFIGLLRLGSFSATGTISHPVILKSSMSPHTTRHLQQGVGSVFGRFAVRGLLGLVLAFDAVGNVVLVLCQPLLGFEGGHAAGACEMC